MTLLRDRLRIAPVAGIVGRLAAAGLRLRHLDDAAGILQQLQRREADARPKEVDEAGDEEPDFRRLSEVVASIGMTGEIP